MSTRFKNTQPLTKLPVRRRPAHSAPILPWPAALVLVIVVHLVALWWVPRLHLNNAPDLYYPEGSEAVQIRDALRRSFPSDELLTVVFQGPDLYGPRFIQRLGQLEEVLEGHRLVDRVSTLANVEHIQGSDDGFSVRRLIDSRSVKDLSPEALQKHVMADRFVPGLLASRDGSTVAMAVRPTKMEGSAERLELKLAVIAAINQVGLQSHFAGDAGPISLDVAQLLSMMSDTTTFVPLTAGLGLLLLAWVVGRLVPVIVGGIAMSTVILPVVSGIAAAGQPYSMATAILPSLLAAYTMATLLHFYAGVQRAHASGGRQRESIRLALAETLKPGAFNAMTTSAGLLSLILVPMPPIQTFGVAGAAGTVMVFITVYFIAPSLLVRFDRKRWPVKRSAMGLFGRIANRACMASMRRPKLAVGMAVALVCLCIPLAMNVRVETDVLKFFAEDHPVSLSTKLVETKLAGVTSLELLLETPERDGLVQPEQLRAIKALQTWLTAQPAVDRVTSHADLIEEMHWAMNNEQSKFRSIPGDAALISQYLLVYDGNDLYELIDRDFSKGRMLVNLNVHGASEIKAVIDDMQTRLAEAPLPRVTVSIGGYGRLFADQVELLVSGQVDSFLGAFGQIFLLMTILWRSPTGALLCMLPNLAPLFFVFVLMGTFGIDLDMATVMIAGVVMGITVDDTIHLYYGYKKRLEAGISVPLALARSFQNSGRAVLAISLLLTCQFMLLAASDFVPTSNFGLMTAVGLLAGQAAELLLLPALLVLKDGRRSTASPGAHKAPAIDAGLATDGAPMLQGSTAPVPAPAAACPSGQLLLVCRGEVCRSRGGDAIWQACQEAHVSVRADLRPRYATPVETVCLKRCEDAPAVTLSAASRPVSAGSLEAAISQAVAQVLGVQAPAKPDTEGIETRTSS